MKSLSDLSGGLVFICGVDSPWAGRHVLELLNWLSLKISGSLKTQVADDTLENTSMF